MSVLSRTALPLACQGAEFGQLGKGDARWGRGGVIFLLFVQATEPGGADAKVNTMRLRGVSPTDLFGIK